MKSVATLFLVFASLCVMAEQEYICTASEAILIETDGSIESIESPPLYINAEGLHMVADGEAMSLLENCEFFGESSVECVLSETAGDYFALTSPHFVYLDSKEEDGGIVNLLIRGRCLQTK